MLEYYIIWQHAYIAWGLAHMSHREGPFMKIKLQKAKNRPFVEFKYLEKTNYTVHTSVCIVITMTYIFIFLDPKINCILFKVDEV